MFALGRWQPVIRAHPYLVDGLLAGAIYALAVIGALDGESPGPTLGGTILAAPFFVALVLRRRWPLAVLAATTLGGPVLAALGETRHPAVLAAGVAAYTVGARLDRATALVAGGASALALGITTVLSSEESWSGPPTLLVIVFIALTTAVGMAVGNHRAYVAAVEERAVRAEQSREDEAHRRVIEERMRIARELHDVVAHHIAVINVQAGVAAHLVCRDPEAGAEALRHVRAASRSVLSELSTLLGVLRSDDDANAPTEPAPSLQRLDTLLESLSRTGLVVTTNRHGDPLPLPAGIDLTGYRIVQEALTNAQKHGGGGGAILDLTYGPDHLVIQIRNDRGPGDLPIAGPTGTGHGILGMRERVAAVGGAFSAGPQPNGGFTVYASLPLPTRLDG